MDKKSDKKNLSLLFSKFTHWVAIKTGHAITFCMALLIVVLWAFLGPYYQFSDTWQLVINTGTTIVTFLMVFLIQNSQNRDTASLLIKIDELIRSRKEAKNELLNIEEKSDEEIERLHSKYEHLAYKSTPKKKPKKPKK